MSTAADSHSTSWRLDEARSELRFTANQMGMTVRGRFPRVQGSLQLDLSRLETSSIDAIVLTEAVEPAMGALRGLLLSDSFLAAGTHPELRFRSDRIEPSGDAYTVHGEVTFRGASRSVSFVTRLVAVDGQGSEPSARVEARGRVDHLIADELLELELALVAVPASQVGLAVGSAPAPTQRALETVVVPSMQGESTPNGPPIRVVALLGSLRRASLNGALLRAAREAAPAGMRIEPFALAGVPFYDGDVETDGEPEAVISLKGVISAADALLLVTPEYNRGLPAVIKNAIDWASRPPFGSPLVGKPVLLMGATTGRSAVKYALQDAAEALDYAQAKPYETRYGVPRAGDLIDGDGRLADARIHAELRELLSAFETAVRRTTVPTQHLAA